MKKRFIVKRLDDGGGGYGIWDRDKETFVKGTSGDFIGSRRRYTVQWWIRDSLEEVTRIANLVL